MVGFKRSGRLGESDILGSAAQKLAVESFRNIANFNVGDAEVAAIVDLLRGAGALAVADVADRLHWSSDKTANALVRGGKAGVLRFSKDGDNTIVALTES